VVVTEKITYLFAIRGAPNTNFTFNLQFVPSEHPFPPGSLSNVLMGGNQLWISQTNVSFSLPDAWQAGPMATNGEAWMELVFAARGTLRFRSKMEGQGALTVMTEPSEFPFLPLPISGPHDWTLRTYAVNALTNVIRISVRPGSRNSPPAVAWIDDLEFIPTPARPPQLQMIFDPTTEDPALRLSFLLEANRTTTIDISTNLLDWEPLTNLHSTLSALRHLQFPLLTNNTPQFFRARIGP
jgi:hypothetical protein